MQNINYKKKLLLISNHVSEHTILLYVIELNTAVRFIICHRVHLRRRQSSTQQNLLGPQNGRPKNDMMQLYGSSLASSTHAHTHTQSKLRNVIKQYNMVWLAIRIR